MANQQHKTTTNKNTTKGETQIPQPDMRFAIQQRSKANSKRGRAQQKQPRTRICHGHSGEKPLCRNSKKMHQTNWLLPRKVKHAFLIVAADRQQRKALAVHHCVLASQSPLTGSCSGVQSKTKRTCRALNGVQEQGECIVGGQIAIVPPPLRGAAPWLRGSGKDGHIRQGRWPVVVRPTASKWPCPKRKAVARGNPIFGAVWNLASCSRYELFAWRKWIKVGFCLNINFSTQVYLQPLVSNDSAAILDWSLEDTSCLTTVPLTLAIMITTNGVKSYRRYRWVIAKVSQSPRVAEAIQRPLHAQSVFCRSKGCHDDIYGYTARISLSTWLCAVSHQRKCCNISAKPCVADRISSTVSGLGCNLDLRRVKEGVLVTKN